MLKRLLPGLFFLALALGAVEFACFIFLSFPRARPSRFDDIQAKRRLVRTSPIALHIPQPELEKVPAHEILHPYLGFVLGEGLERDPFGWENPVTPLQKRSPDKVILAITGGSVARNVYHQAADCLTRILRRRPPFRGRQIMALRLAAGGYKQPQQLFALSYLASLGAEFDIVVNLDGFNEVALPVAGLHQGAFPFYPRNWPLRVQAVPTPELWELVGEIAAQGKKRKNLAALFSRGPLAKSGAAGLAWRILDSKVERALFDLESAAMREKVPPDDYLLTGPRRAYSNEAEFLTDLAEVWRRSSLLMHQICEGQGSRYYHFLQPNQYVPASKEFSSEERRVAYQADHPYRPGAEKGYPYLRRAGRGLARAGVRYHDLTLLFARIAEPIYADACCHYNRRGARRVAAAMARVIARDLSAGASLSGGPFQ